MAQLVQQYIVYELCGQQNKIYREAYIASAVAAAPACVAVAQAHRGVGQVVLLSKLLKACRESLFGSATHSVDDNLFHPHLPLFALEAGILRTKQGGVLALLLQVEIVAAVLGDTKFKEGSIYAVTYAYGWALQSLLQRRKLVATLREGFFKVAFCGKCGQGYI